MKSMTPDKLTQVSDTWRQRSRLPIQIPNVLAPQYIDKELTKPEVEFQGPTRQSGDIMNSKKPS